MKELFKPEDIERKVILILRILHESEVPLGARVIARRMSERNVQLSERTVRYHLKIMDERGLTRLVGRRDGRVITEHGLNEISDARVQDKIGLSISRIDILSFKTTFDVKKKRGLVPVNISFFPQKQFNDAMKVMKPVFQKETGRQFARCHCCRGKNIRRYCGTPGQSWIGDHLQYCD